MAVNKYFRNVTYGREQDVQEDLVIEAIKMHGVDVKYLPRTVVKEDMLFGEDVLSQFNNAIELEVYVKNTTGFEGEGDILSKFGMEMRDQITLVLARKRWGQLAPEKLLDEVGYNLQLETANTGSWGNSAGFLLESGTANGYSISSSRPLEGDRIYFPITDDVYEVKFVEHEAMFYPFGKLYTYELFCELVEYSSERINTGNTAIDNVEDLFSTDVLNYQFQLEDESGVLLGEDGGSLLQEYRVETTSPTANNEHFTQESLEYIDFSERNPFSEVDRY